jgi:hypothetical protein
MVKTDWLRLLGPRHVNTWAVKKSGRVGDSCHSSETIERFLYPDGSARQGFTADPPKMLESLQL